MARIPEEDIERLKQEVSVQRLVEAQGIVLKRHYSYVFNNPLSLVDPTGMETALYQVGNCYTTHTIGIQTASNGLTVHNSTSTFGD